MFENVNESSKYKDVHFLESHKRMQNCIFGKLFERCKIFFKAFFFFKSSAIIHQETSSLPVAVCLLPSSPSSHLRAYKLVARTTPRVGQHTQSDSCGLNFSTNGFLLFFSHVLLTGATQGHRSRLHLCSVYVLCLPAHYHTSKWLICNSTGSL